MREAERYVIGYLLWVISVALAIIDMLVGRGLVMRIATRTDANRWILGAVDRFGILILGLIAFAFVLFCEYYYREGVRRHQLWRRFVQITALELTVLLVAYVAPILLP